MAEHFFIKRSTGGLFALVIVLLFAISAHLHSCNNPTHDHVLQTKVSRGIENLRDDLSDVFGDLTYQSANASLIRRDDYSCGPGNPCSNGACCGVSGYCGYGPTYCGSGCSSNCDATAECGQYAKEPGQKCPLNTCCSQYGFCGTTTDFCTTKCQSNCVEHPTPPGGGSSTGILQNKVIGYYESWADTLACHRVAPTDLPLDALTHVNYAFAYIDPGSLQIVTMDAATEASLFSDTANLKIVKPDLKVFVSVGGWSFSDNGTATQPVYGDIAADSGKRQKFANNVVQFMRQYGFDGIDIDWEYPGAPDRGGKKQDTANYVLLMQTLKQTFDASGGDFGLSFTTPSSYWYLRWFDLPGLLKYADWTNLMTYDLHGIWDSSDPIGAIVQGHTNLTEIKLAAELFWRVNIPPSKIVMGFGFYGRSFTLASSSCTTPGCAFSGASNPGPCTQTGGYLAYYELESVLNNNPSIKPIHDEDAAVMYFVWNNNQWISYDNAATYKQKVDWANSVGLGGAMIWASDQDDDKYSAHAAFLGRTIKSTSSLRNLQLTDLANSNPVSVSQSLASFNGQQCKTYSGKCADLNDNAAMSAACGSGMTVVGWDDAGCGKKNHHYGKPVCCPTITAPKNCIWRGDNNGKGSSRDCSAQCWAGEVNMAGIMSSWGGGFTNDGNTNKCARGKKVFCCPDPGFSQLTSGCGYTGCGKNCGVGQTQLFEAGCFWGGTQKYCCPSPAPFSDCHWVTKTDSTGVDSDCANAVCAKDEIEILRSSSGSGATLCAYGRQQPACCKISKAPDPPAMCSSDLCQLPGVCTNDGTPGIAANKRDLAFVESVEHQALEKRGQDHYEAHIGPYVFILIAAVVNEISRLYAGPNNNLIIRRQYRLRPGSCIGPAIDIQIVAAGTNPPGLTGDQTEHPLEPQFAARFLETIVRGRLRGPNGPLPSPYVPPINADTIDRFWDHPLHGLGLRPAIGGPNGDRPSTAQERFMGAFGSVDWPEPLIPTDSQINGPKGALWGLNDPISLDTIGRQARAAVRADTPATANSLLQSVRIGFAIMEYMNDQDFISRFTLARNQVRTQLGYIETEFANEGIPVTGLQEWWDIALDDFMVQLQTRVRTFTDAAITAAFAPFNTQTAPNLGIYNQVITTLNNYNTRLQNGQGMTFDAQYFVNIQPPT
ncbi:glycoside hydrolase family 18 protein, partial [Aureobasidium melanogenum]